MHTKRTVFRPFVAALIALAPLCARAYGPEGHLIAGLAAEPRLCGGARTAVTELGEGGSLGELGLWADRIRSIPAWRESAPWHYMNIPDDAAIAAFVHPPEGDVLAAIERFRGVLSSRGSSASQRAEALKFLVHFIVDIHQPLHVGRASDRGGNTIELSLHGEKTNLHRFWDTDVIDLADLSISRYVARLGPELARAERSAVELDPEVWAAESLALRPDVYDFGTGRTLNADYVEHAQTITRQRLADAAVRLAATLNDLFCPAGRVGD